jgi:hypothetical protein
MKKLAVLTPCHDGMYHSNYCDLLQAIARRPFLKYMKSENESDIARHRSKMACSFLASPHFADCWGIVTIDADIGGHPSVLDRIASLPEDIAIVGGVYVKKNGDPSPVVRGLTEERHACSPEIVRAECMPTGFTRVSRACLQAVYDSKHVPCCRDKWRLVYHARIMESSAGLGYETEDYAFCLDAAKLGFATWCDRSIRLTHRGSVQYIAT